MQTHTDALTCMYTHTHTQTEGKLEKREREAAVKTLLLGIRRDLRGNMVQFFTALCLSG